MAEYASVIEPSHVIDHVTNLHISGTSPYFYL